MSRRDERRDNQEELRKLDVGRGNGEDQQHNMALRTNHICEEDED